MELTPSLLAPLQVTRVGSKELSADLASGTAGRTLYEHQWHGHIEGIQRMPHRAVSP
jgi:hypothetical protein